MKFKGTKGEWYFEEKINSEGNISISMFSSKGGLLTKLIDDNSKTFEEIKANALLMSKAPEMLEMLQKIVLKLKGNGFPSLQEEIEQLIEEVTKLLKYTNL